MFDSISLSPKVPRAECKIKKAHSLKILFPYIDGVNAHEWVRFNAPYKSLQLINPTDCGTPEIERAMRELELLLS